jgi:MFS family permease
MDVSRQRRWAILGLLFTASLINYLDRATISIALPLIAKDFSLDATQKGLLLSSFFWSYALMQIPIGWAADRFDLRWLYAGAFTLWSIAQGLVGFADGLPLLVAFRIMLGIGESIYLPGGTKIVSLLFSRTERGLASGIFDFGTRTGLVLEGVLVPYLIVQYGWRHTFMILGVTTMVWLLPWFLTVPPGLKGTPAAAAARTTGGAFGWLKPLANRNLLGICLGFFCFDYYWYLLVTWLPDYLVTVRHFTVLKAGFFSALPFLVFGLSEPLGGWIADRLIHRGWNETRTRKGIVTVAFSMGLFLIPAGRVADANTAILFVMGGCLVGLSTGNLIAILQACAPHEDVGLWTGFENFFGNVAGVLAPIATGLLITWTGGSYAAGFNLAVGVLLLGLIAYWFIVGEIGEKKPGFSRT